MGDPYIRSTPGSDRTKSGGGIRQKREIKADEHTMPTTVDDIVKDIEWLVETELQFLWTKDRIGDPDLQRAVNVLVAVHRRLRPTERRRSIPRQ
jgi:hypothetical protein